MMIKRFLAYAAVFACLVLLVLFYLAVVIWFAGAGR